MQQTVPVISFEGKRIEYGLDLHKMEIPDQGTSCGHDGNVWGAGAISTTQSGGKRQMSVAFFSVDSVLVSADYSGVADPKSHVAVPDLTFIASTKLTPSRQ